MSRKGVITKRVKTVQTALSRTAPNRAVRLAENECSARPKSSVRLKSRPKFKTIGRSRITTRETFPRSAKPTTHASAHDHAREPGNNPRGRATFAYHGRCAVRAGKDVPHVRETSANLHRPTTAADRESGHDRSDVPTDHDRFPADRPDRPSQRRGRPEARFEARFIFSSPA
ncbi:unnamed protein product [Microthlaspi erraticum]|uniref:Uncharacterized protein n=1 Tax=Microthlaspi erraticum TaxID=1685480 RepID=A0A6D2L8F9_9BRAS|nr:unnamed protein product [Microthlaspi erraticum]